MKKLLIVVDMLNDFCDKEGVLSKSLITEEYYGFNIIDNVLAKVNEYRAVAGPIIWLGDYHGKDDLEFQRFPAHAVAETWGAQIVEPLMPHVVEHSNHEMMIHKTRYSGFYGTDLEFQLQRLVPEQVEVVGVCTSICVMDTVGGLANRDYNIVVPKDCVADFDPAAHEAALARMEGLYGAKIV